MERPDTLLAGAINKLLLSEGTGSEEKGLLTKTHNLFSIIGERYAKGFTRTPLILRGPNDNFFNDRLQPGGRLDQLYSNKRFNLACEGGELTFEELLDYSLRVNQGEKTLPLGELISRAKADLSPLKPRHFVLSQGDPTESNMTSTGVFFDFETAGYNSFVQETAIFAVHNYSYGHYLTPKYSESGEGSFPVVSSFAQSIDIQHSFDKDNAVLDLRLKFPYPALKRKILEQYVDLVTRRIEEEMTSVERREASQQLRSAILMRYLAVRDLSRYEQKDVALSLALTGHFCCPDEECTTVSDSLLKKLILLI